MCCEGTELSDLLASKIDRAQASRTLCLVYKQQTERGLPLLFFPLSYSPSHIYFLERKYNMYCLMKNIPNVAFTDYCGRAIKPLQLCEDEPFNNTPIYIITLQMDSLWMVDCERVGVCFNAISGRSDPGNTVRRLCGYCPPSKPCSSLVVSTLDIEMKPL